MSARPVFPQLHALIGEAADLLPADVAARIETLLDDPKDLLPALLARMDGRDAADGRRLEAQGLSPAQAATMAGLSRTLAGLNALMGMGGYLINSQGGRFMFRYSPEGEKAPRPETPQRTRLDTAPNENGPRTSSSAADPNSTGADAAGEDARGPDAPR